MSKLTIAKKINVFTIALALIGIIGSAFSVIASISGIKHTETLNDVYLSANLLATKLKTNVLNIGADVDRYIATHQESHITNIHDRIREPNVDKLGALLKKYNKELSGYQQGFTELHTTAKDFPLKLYPSVVQMFSVPDSILRFPLIPVLTVEGFSTPADD